MEKIKSLREINLNLKEGRVEMDSRKETKEMIRRLILHKKKLYAEADYDDTMTILHPIPDSLQSAAKKKFKAGDKVNGVLKNKMYYTEKRDSSKEQRHIFIQYFVPRDLNDDKAA